jgi:hypothetical protein
MRSHALVVLTFLLLPAAPALGQEVFVGSPVRVVLSQPSGRKIAGELIGITDDSIFIARTHRRDVRLSRGSVRALYTGRHNSRDQSTFAGVLMGAPVGMLAGAAAGSILPTAGSGRRAIGFAAGAAGGIVVGAILGGIIGEHHPQMEWSRVPWPESAHPRH